MADTITFLVYLLLLLFSVGLLKRFTVNKNKMLIFLSLTLMIVVAGLRYNTGRDYENYKFLYEEAPTFVESIAIDMEVGYSALVDILNSNDLKVWSFFTICAFLTYALLFYSFNNYHQLLYLGIFFYITYGFYFYSFNGVRQAVAMSFLAVGAKYIVEKKIVKYIIVIVLGGLMHKSLFVFLPFYFFIDKIKLDVKIWYVLFFISLILHFIPITDLFDLSFFTNLISDSEVDYSGYAENLNDDEGQSGQLSLGYLTRVVIGFFILYFYKRITNLDKDYIVYYNFALIGILLYNAFSHVLFMSRINYYFLFFSIFALSFIIAYLNKSRKQLTINIIMAFFVALYCYGIFIGENGVSPYQFISF
ncbi:MAG: EpsG family protein [Maribacter arcticus]|uniref:EpsG family protein n=1 Tax=Maribacter arcticus TaxID=561365 RepID=UPI0030026B72